MAKGANMQSVKLMVHKKTHIEMSPNYGSFLCSVGVAIRVSLLSLTHKQDPYRHGVLLWVLLRYSGCVYKGESPIINIDGT